MRNNFLVASQHFLKPIAMSIIRVETKDILIMGCCCQVIEVVLFSLTQNNKTLEKQNESTQF